MPFPTHIDTHNSIKFKLTFALRSSLLTLGRTPTSLAAHVVSGDSPSGLRQICYGIGREMGEASLPPDS